MLLQKTLLNIEGLGRQLDPDLDLWKTAKPFLERWMSEQMGWRGMLRTLQEEAPQWAITLPKLPRLMQEAMNRDPMQKFELGFALLLAEQRKRNTWLMAIAGLLGALTLTLWLIASRTITL